MSEMPPKSMRNYMTEADRITKCMAYFKQRKLENNKLDHATITKSDYDMMDNWYIAYSADATLYPDFFERIYNVKY